MLLFVSLVPGTIVVAESSLWCVDKHVQGARTKIIYYDHCSLTLTRPVYVISEFREFDGYS